MEPEDYLDFELEIGAKRGRTYPLAVLRSAAGEARGIMHFPYDELALENRLLTLQMALLRSGGNRRRIPLQDEQQIEDFGQTLYNALFTGDIGTRFAVSQREAAHQGKGLRLKLRILSSEMAALPWEYLYEPSHGDYVCLSRNTPIIRYIELPEPPQPLLLTPPLRILGILASPMNLPRLDLERERQRIEKAIDPLQRTGQVQLTWLSSPTWQEVQRTIRNGPWHIFHFIGHGGFDTQTDEGLVAFEDEEGQAHLLRATLLGRLLADHRSLRLVVLNSCEGARGSQRTIFSSTAAILVRRGIPAVLAMQYEITDKAAIIFSHAFYEALSDGIPVDAAVSEARKAVSFGIENTLEWGIPVLFMRSPNGILFTLKRESASSLGQTPLPTPPFQDTFAQSLLRSTTDLRPTTQDEQVDVSDEQPIGMKQEGIAETSGNAQSFPVAASSTPQTLSSSENSLSSLLAVGMESAASSTDRPSIEVTSSLHQTLPTDVKTALDDQIYSPQRTISRRVALGMLSALALGGVGAAYWLISRPHAEVSNVVAIYLGHTNAVWRVKWSPDGRRIASGGGDHTVQIWYAYAARPFYTYLGHHVYNVRGIAWSPDGTRIASGGDDTTVQIWDSATGNLFYTYRGHKSLVWDIAWSPDGTRIASASWDKTVQVWRATTGAHIYTYRGHTDTVRGVAWSPDSTRIVSAGRDLLVNVWEADTGRSVSTFGGHPHDTLTSVAWSPSGTYIASAGGDKTIQVWEAITGDHIYTFTGHTDTVLGVDWFPNPNNPRIASASSDKTVQVWDALTGNHVYTFRRHMDKVFSAPWSPDGSYIASGSQDKTVQVWQPE